MTMSSTVQYVPQTITASEKAVARSNIGIGDNPGNAWYLDTVNGDDLNSGLSMYSPKKTGDTIINAIKASPYPATLHILNGSADFDAANWTSTSVPNLSIFCETGYNNGNVHFSNVTGGSLSIVDVSAIQFTSCTLTNLYINSPSCSIAFFVATTITGRVKCDCKYFQTVSGTLTYNGVYDSGDTFFVRAYNFECDIINNGSMEINASFCMLNSYSSNNASLTVVSKYVNLGGALSSIRSSLYIKTDLLQQNSTFLVDSGTSTSIRFSLDIDAGHVNQNYGMDILSTYGVCNVRMKTSLLYTYRSPKSIIINALNYDIVCQFDIGSITAAVLSPDEDHAMIALYAPTAGKKLALDVRISSMKQNLGILGTYDTNECFIKKYSEVGSILVKLNNTDALNKVEYFDGYGLDGFTGYSSRPRWILSGRNTTLGIAHTDLEKIIFILKRGPEASYTDEYLMRFTTNAANALNQIKLCYDYGVVLTTGKDISDRILKLTAAQCDTLYELGSDLVLVTATKNVTWSNATKTITAGDEYQVLGLNEGKDSYIYCDKAFGVVTTLGSIVPTLANSVQLCPEEVQLENSSDYVISASSGTATITGKNTSISLVALDAKNTEEWFLDTYSGDDNNSGLSTYAPMKTASAIIAKITDLISGGESASRPRRLNILYNSSFNNPSVVINGVTGIPFYDIEAPDGVSVSITNSTWSFGNAKIRGGSYTFGGNTINSGLDIEAKSLSISSTENWSSGTFVIDISDSIDITSNWNINNCSCRIKCGNSIYVNELWAMYSGTFHIDIEENLNIANTKNINTYNGDFYFDLKGTLNLEGTWMFHYCNLFLNSKIIQGTTGTLVGNTGATKTIIKTDYYSLTNYIVASSVTVDSIFRIIAKRLNIALTNPIINYGANTGINCDVLIEVDEIGSRAPTVGNTQGNSTCKVWQFKYPDFVEQNTWYLDTVSGNDSNSGLTRGAPKKTGDALVIAAKAVGKMAGKLVIMTSNSGVVFTSANWSSTNFPFFDVECESVWTTVEWNNVVFSAIVKIRSGVHTFNYCTGNASQTLKVHQLTINSGTWAGQTDIDSETSLTANGMTCGGTTTIRTQNLSIPSMLMVYGSVTIQTASIYGDGSIGSYSNMQVWLDIQTNSFSLEGVFQFPSQVDNSSIKVSISKMARTAITKLLYLGANTGITVNYQLIVDTMGSIVPMEIGNPAGTVAGKVIELLKYKEGLVNEITGTINEIDTTLTVDPDTGERSYGISVNDNIKSKLSSLITGTKESRSFPLSVDESIVIKIATITDSDADGKWHIDFKVHFKIAQTTLSFMQDQFNTPNHFRFTYDNESCIESWVYNQDTGVSGLIRIVKTATVDNVCSYYLVAYHGYSSEAEEIEIVDGHVSGASAEFSNDAYALLSSIIPTDNYYLTHKVRRDLTMSGTGSYYDPFSSKPTQVTSNDESVTINSSTTEGVTTHDISVIGKLVGSTWINVEEVVESDINKLQFALANPDYFVKGATIYGGTILPATTGDFNSPVHNGYFTGYYNTLNAPPVQAGNPSWFVHHMNSNAGPLYAVQIAYAYTSTIICYERTKINGVWQAWQLRGSGSSVSEVAHIATGDSLGAKDIIQLQAGSSTQWSAHAAMCSTIGAITPQMTSEMGFIATQVVTGNFIIAAYKVETNLAHSLICATGVTALPASAGWINTPVLNHVKSIAANDRVYLVVMTDSNGNAIAGASCTTFNIQPYVAGIKTNMGVLTEAPATLTFDSETTSRPFIYMVK